MSSKSDLDQDSESSHYHTLQSSKSVEPKEIHSSQASFISSKIREERENEIEDLKLKKALSSKKHASDSSINAFKSDELTRVKAPRDDIIRI